MSVTSVAKARQRKPHLSVVGHDVLPVNRENARLDFIGYGRYTIRCWTPKAWAQLPDRMKPLDAYPFGEIGWVYFEPAAPSTA